VVPHSFTLKMEEECSSETSVNIYETAWYPIYLSIALHPFVEPWPFSSVSWSFTQSVGLPGRGISLSQGWYLHTGKQKPRINTHPYPCLKWALFERAKTVHALYAAATVIGTRQIVEGKCPSRMTLFRVELYSRLLTKDLRIFLLIWIILVRHTSYNIKWLIVPSSVTNIKFLYLAFHILNMFRSYRLSSEGHLGNYYYIVSTSVIPEDGP
jgi:hypothetical protein